EETVQVVVPPKLKRGLYAPTHQLRQPWVSSGPMLPGICEGAMQPTTQLGRGRSGRTQQGGRHDTVAAHGMPGRTRFWRQRSRLVGNDEAGKVIRDHDTCLSCKLAHEATASILRSLNEWPIVPAALGGCLSVDSHPL